MNALQQIKQAITNHETIVGKKVSIRPWSYTSRWNTYDGWDSHTDEGWEVFVNGSKMCVNTSSPCEALMVATEMAKNPMFLSQYHYEMGGR